ncbi:hypothetical protein DFP72DRAFT_823858 [Ephemerocybe angulata]|uniref:Uncharacterized protein n=1 Tax=Ephemerocybe angulata TaxID=980116 RepID=A0A8H6HF83_9AGAR|nr:hypothetical protein DFP72DRAFT_823858 [Tulosesus angulatus]
MPPKYSHVKKRVAAGLLKPGASTSSNLIKETYDPNNPHGQQPQYQQHIQLNTNHFPILGIQPNSILPNIDKNLSQAMAAVAHLERAIARLLLLRFEQDIARLYSTRLYVIAITHIPVLVAKLAQQGGPGWVAMNAESEEVKDFFRAIIGMDMREAGERVATKSVLWSYTVLRRFALAHNVPVCVHRGLHSIRLLPFYPDLKAHVDALEAQPLPTFEKPAFFGGLEAGYRTLEEACNPELANAAVTYTLSPSAETRLRLRLGYTRLVATLWKVAREFDVRGYGQVLRDKLTVKWCECGCSTEHLGEVCEKTVREEEEDREYERLKKLEWDGRGSGVFAWETYNEEDIWDTELDFGQGTKGRYEAQMTIGEMMEWRFIKAEQEKEMGNTAFRNGNYLDAVESYRRAQEIEPELPHYQLNLAAAHLKLNEWMEAEKACTRALSQHRSSKGLFRRAKARQMQGKIDEAIEDYRALIRLQPHNTDAMIDLLSLLHRPPVDRPPDCVITPANNPWNLNLKPETDAEVAALYQKLGIAKPKRPKPIPFQRTKADDVKLKIVPIDPRSGEPGANSNLGEGGDNTPEEEDPAGTGGADLKSKLKSGKARGKEKKEDQGRSGIMRNTAAECGFAYFAWDRYVVKKVD